MNSLLPDVPLNALSDDDIPAAISSLIDAAMAAFDSDRDISRRYLSRASALLRIKRRTGIDADSSCRLAPQGGLMTWQLNRLVDYIETHLTKKMTGRELSELINLSHGQMCRAFKVSVGVAPFQYISRRRVELACTLMKTAKEPLSQIALACGLYDQSHFCRVFRRMTGMSPSAWRRSPLACGAVDSRIMDATCAIAATVGVPVSRSGSGHHDQQYSEHRSPVSADT
jgi:AraC family transcriptional regulator